MKKRITINYFLHRYPIDNIGNITVRMLNILKYFQDRNYDILFCDEITSEMFLRVRQSGKASWLEFQRQLKLQK